MKIMQLDKVIKERKSVRKFLDKKPDWRKIIEAIDVARYSPLAGNISTLKFILLDDKEKIQKIAECCQQDFISQCHYVVVVCSKSSLLENEFSEKARDYNKQQVGAAIENFLLKIVDLGLDTCWVGAFSEDMIKRELEIPENVEVEAVFPIGYEMGKCKKCRKIDLDNILYFNKYKNKKMKPPKKIQ